MYRQVGFVVGAPRSGTTWLQQLLLVHPLITTGGESHLFCEGLPEVLANFRNPDATSHLSTWVAEPEMFTAMRAMCDVVFAAQRDGTRPNAKIVVEKTPNHMQQSALQAALYPDALYVHIIRDGRDSAASQRQLWGGMSSEFSSPRKVAEGWAESVRDIRRAFAGLESYIELRYEDVVSDTPAALATIFDHFGLPHDRALCEAAANFGKAPVNSAPSSVAAGSVRKHSGNVLAERGVARAAGDLLVELGYANEAEVRAMASQRNLQTMTTDAREAASDALTKAGRVWTKGRARLVSRGQRNARASLHDTAKAVAETIEGNDSSALKKLVASGSSVDVDALFARVGGHRTTGRRAADGFAQLTAIGPDGTRTLLRIAIKDGRVVSIDVA